MQCSVLVFILMNPSVAYMPGVVQKPLGEYVTSTDVVSKSMFFFCIQRLTTVCMY